MGFLFVKLQRPVVLMAIKFYKIVINLSSKYFTTSAYLAHGREVTTSHFCHNEHIDVCKISQIDKVSIRSPSLSNSFYRGVLEKVGPKECFKWPYKSGQGGFSLCVSSIC